jgi:small subunit ribosomal protein S4
MAIRKSKKYSKPRKPFDKIRIEQENTLVERYGLKNKREIWKADSAISKIRNLAKNLIIKSDEEKQNFIKKLHSKGFKVTNLPDILGLNKEDWLKRRLQTVVHFKKLSLTAKQARQLITHKHVSIGDRIINIPSYMVSLEEEPMIKLNIALKIKETKKSKIEEIKEKVLENKIMEKAQ